MCCQDFFKIVDKFILFVVYVKEEDHVDKQLQIDYNTTYVYFGIREGICEGYEYDLKDHAADWMSYVKLFIARSISSVVLNFTFKWICWSTML